MVDFLFILTAPKKRAKQRKMQLTGTQWSQPFFPLQHYKDTSIFNINQIHTDFLSISKNSYFLSGFPRSILNGQMDSNKIKYLGAGTDKFQKLLRPSIHLSFFTERSMSPSTLSPVIGENS